MSGYQFPARQPSSASTVSLGGSSTYSFPSSTSTSRSGTVTSMSSTSSRYSAATTEPRTDSPGPLRKASKSLGASSPSVLSRYQPVVDEAAARSPATTTSTTTTTSPLNPSPLGSQRLSTRLQGHARTQSVPSTANGGPVRPLPTPSPFNSANRSNVISGTTSLKKEDIDHLRSSSVSHFRTLSKLTGEGSKEEFGIEPADSVVGLQGRKRLQRAKTDNMSMWDRMTWMDKRRQYIQAYEYLCHIGEAKEWMEDCIGEPIPPIVELEEALRDGVALAKLTQIFAPELVPRIFQHPKLQYRHMDNINRFFGFLKKVELPEVFFFETTDLYNKKNIPKVIYCIHALSFLLFRLGLTNNAVGNLVGKLEFTEAEIQNTQKGLDVAGVSMPAFRGVNKHFEVEEEPEPVETEEERIVRELHECRIDILEFQDLCRGALVRMRLGDMMEALWDNEEYILELQARIRGKFARVAAAHRVDMARSATAVQAVARGYLVRKRASRNQQQLGDNKQVFARLQAKIRGNKVRDVCAAQRKSLEQNGAGTTRLQAAVRGGLLRRRLAGKMEDVHDSEQSVKTLQAVARGALTRRKQAELKARLEKEEPAVTKLQARIRGGLLRGKANKDAEALETEQDTFATLGAAVRGMLVREEVKRTNAALQKEEKSITGLQALARGKLARVTVEKDQEMLQASAEDDHFPRFQAAIRGHMLRQRFNADKEALESFTPQWIQLQAMCRGALVRWDYRWKIASLFEAEMDLIDLQAQARGVLARNEVDQILDDLLAAEEDTTQLQGFCRGALVRWQTQDIREALQDEMVAITDLQARCRGYMLRLEMDQFMDDLEEESHAFTVIQANIRGALLRHHLDEMVLAIQDEEETIVDLQALSRGTLERKKFNTRLKHFQDNMQKVIKIQSFVRAKQQGEAYKSLMGGKNPPVGTVKNFVHLLNDSDFDFDEEIEFEALRKKVVQHVRANELAETYVDQLDVKIALLVKNKITLDEVIKHQKRFTGHVGNILSNTEFASADPFDLKALNQNSRKRLERYQQMFYALQTQPQYLSRLFRRIREQNTAEKEMKRIENLVMGVFGYSQKRREEFYLLKLMVRSIREEIDKCERPDDFLRVNFFWGKLMGSYIRSPRDRKFMRDLMGQLIKQEIIENEELDLESDPLQIYRASINNEELRTGMRSRRDPDITRDLAIKDPETRDTFVAHLQALRSLCDDFMSVLEDNVHRMPYGIRYIARESIEALMERFPDQGQEGIIQVVEHFLYQKYFHPAVIAPDSVGILLKTPTPLQKKNLGEFAKVLNQITSGRLFALENVFLQPLNEYVSVAIRRFKDVFKGMIDVPSIEARFEIDEFEDLTSKKKPILYIKMSDIFAIHRLIAQEIDTIAASRDDPLREIIGELGSVQTSEVELKTVGNTEISLQLDPSFQRIDDPDSEVKALLVETKRCILYIIRVQTGGNLVEILVKPITPEDEEKWETLVKEEREDAGGKTRGAYSDHTMLTDIYSMSYAELKRVALENILLLESHGKITRRNAYQDLLNDIANDIRTKHRRRVQRSREMETVHQTLAHLREKSAYLDAQLQSYNDYIEQAMVTLQTKKGKKRTILPFTRQYFHMRELQRSGRVPKFGSYKYTARGLADKGVLVKLEGWPERKWDRVGFTISSDEVGVFFVEASNGSMMIPGASQQVLLDDLLQMQFNNNQFMTLCDGMIKFNVNLFLHLLFRKFYRDE